jgi:hypothetical protein
MSLFGGMRKLPGEPYENVIVLSDEFFEEVTVHPIPTDLEAVKLLSSAPAVLDLFVWLSYRCFTSNAPGNLEKSSISGKKRYGSFGWNVLPRLRQMAKT